MHESRGLILDIMQCIDAIVNDVFLPKDVYAFEPLLRQKHPGNTCIKDKIRQQLQILRSQGWIEFADRGIYRKTSALS